MPGKPISVTEFMGIDLRKTGSTLPLGALIKGSNMQITSGKGVRSRPGTCAIAQLPEESIGLFTVNGQLTTVAPDNYPDVFSAQTPAVAVRIIGNGQGYARDGLKRVHGVETYGQDSTGRGFPYLSIERTDGVIEHHYLDRAPSFPGDSVETVVFLPYEPSPGLTKLDSRLWAPSDLFGTVQFNSILNGARDWSETGDAGFIPAANQAPGDRRIRGLSHYRNLLAVAFEDSLVLYAVDENPDNITLVEVFDGPGTRFPGTITNVVGDLFYISQGGVRRLRNAAVEGEREESQDALNSIDSLVQALSTSVEPVSIWSPSRSQYLAAFGSTVLVFTHIPSESTFGWGVWNLPFEITDWAQDEGRLYARDTENKVHQFSEDFEDDSGVPFEWELKTGFVGRDEKARLWQFVDLGLSMQGTAEAFAYPDITDPEGRDSLGTFTDTTTPFDRIGLWYATDAVAIGLKGQGPFQLDGFSLRLNQLAV